jgi:16S rRNA processing protein RimM
VAPDTQPSFITIARIARTRGNRGEVLADLYTDFPDRFNQLREVWLVSNEGTQRVRMTLEETWEHKGRIVLKFTGIDSISDAAVFANYWVEIPKDQAMPLPDGSYFDHDLVGCVVKDISGKRIGTVIEVLHFAGNSQLLVEDGGRERLIPAVESICVQISIGDKQIVIDPPQGLLDLDK